MLSNPLEVIEQITHLLFLRRLDVLHTRAEKKAGVTGGRDRGREVPARQKYAAQVGDDDSTYSEHMKDARFTIPTPALLSKVVDALDDIPMDDRDTNGDLTSTCSARSPRRGPTVSSVPRATSSS